VIAAELMRHFRGLGGFPGGLLGGLLGRVLGRVLGAALVVGSANFVTDVAVPFEECPAPRVDAATAPKLVVIYADDNGAAAPARRSEPIELDSPR
jgi:hypothetical protein